MVGISKAPFIGSAFLALARITMTFGEAYGIATPAPTSIDVFVPEVYGKAHVFAPRRSRPDMPILFLLLFLMPFLEIYVLITVGGWIGFLPTVALVLALSLLGAALLRRQGLTALFKAQGALASGRMPLDAMVDGAGLTLAGALLMTPGLITDAMGFALLIPPVRRYVLHWVFGRLISTHLFEVKRPSPKAEPPRSPKGGTTIEGDYHRLDE
jgi:UPF0716 protein FxsA